MTPGPPLITVIIVNYNSGDRLSRCLECLNRQCIDDFDIIVVDNASSDASMAHADRWLSNARVINADGNLGFAAANNLAVKSAASEWIVFLNPDAYPDPNWLAALLDATQRHPGIDAFGSTQIDAHDPSRLDGAGDAYQVFGISYRGHNGWPVSALPQEGECFAPCAAAAMYRRTTFEMLGGFEESFFCYSEDVDLGFRLRLAGGRAVQVRDAKVLHEGSGISGARSAFTVYYGHRNRIWTYYRNMPLGLLCLSLPFHVATNLFLLLLCAASGNAVPYLKAMRDGYSGLRRVKRNAVRSTQTVSSGSIARALTWSPLKAWRKEADLRPLDGN